jgi:hypothetical protein
MAALDFREKKGWLFKVQLALILDKNLSRCFGFVHFYRLACFISLENKTFIDPDKICEQPDPV